MAVEEFMRLMVMTVLFLCIKCKHLKVSEDEQYDWKIPEGFYRGQFLNHDLPKYGVGAPHPQYLNPIVVIAEGCTGSSITGRILRKLLIEREGIHGTGAGSVEVKGECLINLNLWETLRPAKNCLLARELEKQSHEAHRGTVYRHIIYKQFEITSTLNMTWVVNPLSLKKEQSEALIELGATVISLSRKNALDRVICKVHDCFLSGLDGSNHIVDQETGKNSDLCFDRRRYPNVTTTVYLDTNTLVANLKEEVAYEKIQVKDLIQMGWRKVWEADVHYEDLTAFESGEMGRSAKAWMVVFKAIGYPFRDITDAIRSLSELKDESGEKMYNSRPPEGSQKKKVQNWAEVKATILATKNQQYIGFMR